MLKLIHILVILKFDPILLYLALNNYFQYNKRNKSLEKLKKKSNSKTSFLDNRKSNDIIKYSKNYNYNNNIKLNR